MTETRKIAAILAADVVGFSRMASARKVGRLIALIGQAARNLFPSAAPLLIA